MSAPRSFWDLLTANSSAPGVDPATEGRLRFLIGNALLARKDWLRSITDPRRNLEEECGYPSGWVNPEVYQQLYDREALPARVVEVMPKECWQVQPEVFEDEDPKITTPFEEAANGLGRQLGEETEEESLYEEQGGGAIWEYLRRADIISGVGQYGVVLLGIDDGRPLNTPAVPKIGRRLSYLRCFPETQAQITRFESDESSRRYGRPLEYLLSFHDTHDQNAGTGIGQATRNVHWSRVVHLADVSHQAHGSEVFAAPRMRPVLNRLLDLRKLHSGSAEMYWRGAFPGLSFQTHPTLGGDPDIDLVGLKDEIENYMNSLQRYMATSGMDVKSLAPQVVDPSPQIERQIEAICIKIGCPKRVFMGSERGELASSQDDAAWNDRLKERQHGYLTPRIIVPFFSRLVHLGVLPRPRQLRVHWPDLTSQSNVEKADIALKRTQALGQYAASGAAAIMPPELYLPLFQGLTEQETIKALELIAKYAKAMTALSDTTGNGQPANPSLRSGGTLDTTAGAGVNGENNRKPATPLTSSMGRNGKL